MSSQANVKVLGVQATPGPDGSLPLRREIRDLEVNFPDQFNLFVLGMRALQAAPKEDPQSYYQIAGIHGMPYKIWSNATGIANFEFGGYCTHSSILFATWHRPYLALFEQALYNQVQRVATSFPTQLRARYVEAAKLVRLPYFDWAVNVRNGAPSLPLSIANSTIRVVDVDGRRKSIENPLFSFNISQVRPDTGDLANGWDRRARTVRHPDSRGNSRNAIIEQELDNESAALRQELSLILLSYTDFDDFSNSAWRPNGQARAYSSLEGLHDDIHGRTGGSGGHMSALDVSAMDPFFWLHHCNVDRIWAMWQDLNPNEFLSPRSAPWSTFSVRRGTREDAMSPLSPFWDATGTAFWNSERVKFTTPFGYAYPETQSWLHRSREEYQRELRRTITRLYGSNPFLNFAQTVAPRDAAADRPTIPSVSAAKPTLASLAANPARMATRSLAAGVRSLAAGGGQEPAQKPMVAASKEAGGSNPGHDGDDDSEGDEHVDNPVEEGDIDADIPDSLAHLCPNGQYTDWIVNIRTQKHALGQTYRVIVFLGDFSGNPADWAGNNEYNIVGRVTALGRASETGCSKCKDDQEAELVIGGAVPLTSALLQDIAAGKLQSLEPKDVVPHLRRHLHWRIKLWSGVDYPVDQVAGLKVSVCSSKVTLGSDGVPSYTNEYTVHKEVTTGRVGGLGEDED